MDVNGLLSAMIAQLQAQKVSTTTENTSAKNSSSTEADFAAYLSASHKNCNSTTLDSIFNEAAKNYNVDVNLLRAIGMAESNFQTDATSYVGAQGIMQLMPSTAEYLGVKDAYDAKQNIFGGAKYISQLLKQFDGNTSLALAAYNAGSGNVQKYGGIPPFTETQNYVKKVLDYYENGVTIPSDCNIVSIAESGSITSSDAIATTQSTNLLQQLTSSLQDLQNSAALSVASNTDNTVAIWNTDSLDFQSKSLLSQLQELLLKMNEEETEFSYEDYGRFIQVYLDRVSLTTFQNAVDGKDASLPEELQEKLEDFQAEMNGEESSTNQNLDSMYSYQTINYNPTVLKLLSPEEIDKI